jgi:hypothetical protein
MTENTAEPKTEPVFVRGNEHLDRLLSDPQIATDVADAQAAADEMDRIYAMNLAMIRKAAQMTQVEVARKLGVGLRDDHSDQSVASWHFPLRRPGLGSKPLRSEASQVTEDFQKLAEFDRHHTQNGFSRVAARVVTDQIDLCANVVRICRAAESLPGIVILRSAAARRGRGGGA